MTGILIGILLTIHIIVCVLLILIVLMQRPRSEGLGTAFGGGVADSLFGSGAGNVLTKITTWLGIIFFSTTFLLAWLYSHRTPSTSTLGSRLRQAAAATATNAPTAAPVAAPVTNAVPSKSSK